MSEQNVQLIHAAYDNFRSGDLPALLDKMDASVEWQLPVIANARISGRRHGREKVREFFMQLAADQDAISFEPREFVAQGDTVVAIGQYEWRVKATGRSFKSDFTHVFTVRDGRLTRFREFLDSAAATEAYRAG